MTVKITLYGDSAEEFREMQERLDSEYPGSSPGNAETVRILMELAEIGPQRH